MEMAKYYRLLLKIRLIVADKRSGAHPQKPKVAEPARLDSPRLHMDSWSAWPTYSLVRYQRVPRTGDDRWKDQYGDVEVPSESAHPGFQIALELRENCETRVSVREGYVRSPAPAWPFIWLWCKYVRGGATRPVEE
jgi:hypothetical protein